MRQIYTTQQLIDVLNQDRTRNIVQARQLVEGSGASEEFIDISDPNAMGRNELRHLMSTVNAHLDIRGQIHEYQRKHGISGLIEEFLVFGGRSFRQIAIHEELITLDSDFTVLSQQKNLIRDFWLSIVNTSNLEMSCPREYRTEPVTLDKLKLVTDSCDWTHIIEPDPASNLESIVLTAGRGQKVFMQDDDPDRDNYVTFFYAAPLTNLEN